MFDNIQNRFIQANEDETDTYNKKCSKYVHEIKDKIKLRRIIRKNIFCYQIILVILIFSNVSTFIYFYFQNASLSNFANELVTSYENKIYNIKEYLKSKNIAFVNNEINNDFNISDTCNCKYENIIIKNTEEKNENVHKDLKNNEMKELIRNINWAELFTIGINFSVLL